MTLKEISNAFIAAGASLEDLNEFLARAEEPVGLQEIADFLDAKRREPGAV